MNRIIILGVFLFQILIYQAQNHPKEFENSIYELLNDISNEDWDAIEYKYIDSNQGMYLFYPIGAYKDFKQVNSLEECVKTAPSIFSIDNIFEPIKKVDKPSKVIKDNLQYSCEKGWNKEGLFIEKQQDYPLMTTTMNYLISADLGVKYSDIEFEKAIKLEKNSVRIIFTKSNLILHLKKIRGKWRIIFLDLITTNCDA